MLPEAQLSCQETNRQRSWICGTKGVETICEADKPVVQCSYITPLAACWHSLCRHSHNNVLRFILYAGFIQSLNVALTELHIGLGVAKLTGVVVNVLDSHVQLCRSGERITGSGIPCT